MPTIECQKNASDRINTKNHQKQKQYKKSLLIRVPIEATIQYLLVLLIFSDGSEEVGILLAVFVGNGT